MKNEYLLLKQLIFILLLTLFLSCKEKEPPLIESKYSPEREIAYTQDGIIINKLLEANINVDRDITKRGNNLASASVGVSTGGISEIFMRKNFPQNSPYCYDDISDAFASLNAHRIDYILAPYTTCLKAIRLYPAFALLPDDFYYEQENLGLQKNREDRLNDDICNTLDELIKDGTINYIFNRWIRDDNSLYTPIAMPKRKTRKILRVGVAANREPICFKLEDKCVGAACDVIEIIAYRLGMRVEYYDMKSTALYVALTSNKIDIILSNFSPTTERKNFINFSSTYYINPLTLLTTVDNAEEMLPPSKLSFWQKVKESFVNNIIAEKRYQLLWKGLLVTLVMSIITAFSITILGFLLCMMRNSKNIFINKFAVAYISIFRSVPTVVLLMLMFYVFFASSSMTGITISIISLSLSFSPTVSQIIYSALNGIDPSQKEGAISLGFTNFQANRYIIFPQLWPIIFPAYKGALLAMIKMTAIVGYVAVEDLTKVGDIIRSRTFDAFFPIITIAIIYLLLTNCITSLLQIIQIKIAPKRTHNRNKNSIHKKYMTYD